MTLQRKAPLLRKAELRSKARAKPWRRPEAEKVTQEDWATVMSRDGGCVAPKLGATDPCRDRWGEALPARGRYRPDLLELDHIRPLAVVGKRAPSVPRWMVAMCPWHHRLGNPPWATGHRAEIRDHLAELYGGTDDTE